MPGKMIIVNGSTGVGKSSFASSASAHGLIAAACIPPGEQDTYLGADGKPLTTHPHTREALKGIEVTTFNDDNWLPMADKFEAGAFKKLFKWIMVQRERKDLFAIVIDTLTGVSEICMQGVLAGERRGSPERGSYSEHNSHMMQFINLLRPCVERNINVVVTTHVKMRELEGAGDAKLQNVGSGMNPKMELTFEERLLPYMHGSLNQKILGEFSGVLYFNVQGAGVNSKYYMSALPSKTDNARVRWALKDPKKAAKIAPNWTALMEALR